MFLWTGFRNPLVWEFRVFAAGWIQGSPKKMIARCAGHLPSSFWGFQQLNLISTVEKNTPQIRRPAALIDRPNTSAAFLFSHKCCFSNLLLRTFDRWQWLGSMFIATWVWICDGHGRRECSCSVSLFDFGATWFDRHTTWKLRAENIQPPANPASPQYRHHNTMTQERPRKEDQNRRRHELHKNSRHRRHGKDHWTKNHKDPYVRRSYVSLCL